MAYKLMQSNDFERIYFFLANYLSKKYFDYDKLFIQPKPALEFNLQTLQLFLFTLINGPVIQIT